MKEKNIKQAMETLAINFDLPVEVKIFKDDTNLIEKSCFENAKSFFNNPRNEKIDNVLQTYNFACGYTYKFYLYHPLSNQTYTFEFKNLIEE